MGILGKINKHTNELDHRYVAQFFVVFFIKNAFSHYFNTKTRVFLGTKQLHDPPFLVFTASLGKSERL